MKATKILMSLLALIVFAGCSTETIDENTKNLETFTVIASHIDEQTAERMWIDAETRATINAEDKNIWELNDKLAFTPAGGAQCTLSATSVSEDGKSATFEGEGASFPGVTTFYAAYPSKTTVTANGIAMFNISNEQDGSAQSAMLLYGEGVRTSNTEIEVGFRPVAAILHVTTTEKMDRIVIESCNNENIAGSFFNDGTFSGYSTSITVDPEGTSNDFYVALPAGISLSKGYKIHYYRSNTNEQMLYTYHYNSGTSFEGGKGYKVNFTRAWSPISVNLGARSSHAFYEDGKITEANACNAETIYFSNTTANGVALNCASSYSGISSTLVEECGFSIDGTEYKATYDSATKTFSIANTTGLSWGTSRTVSAYIKIKGGDKIWATTRTMNITGLPYKADGNPHKINTSGTTYPWTNESSYSNTVEWRNTSAYLVFYHQAWPPKTFGPKIATPKFSINASTNIQVKSTVVRKSSKIWSPFEIGTYTTSNSISNIYSSSTPASGKHTYNVAVNSALTSTTNRIVFYSEPGTAGSNMHTLSDVQILYR